MVNLYILLLTAGKDNAASKGTFNSIIIKALLIMSS